MDASKINETFIFGITPSTLIAGSLGLVSLSAVGSGFFSYRLFLRQQRLASAVNALKDLTPVYFAMKALGIATVLTTGSFLGLCSLGVYGLGVSHLSGAGGLEDKLADLFQSRESRARRKFMIEKDLSKVVGMSLEEELSFWSTHFDESAPADDPDSSR